MNKIAPLTRIVALAMLVAAPQFFAADAEAPKAPATEKEAKLEARVKELEGHIKQLEQELEGRAKDQDMLGDFRQKHNFGRDFDDIFNKLQRELDRDLGPGVNPFGPGGRSMLGNKPRLGVELAEPSDELRERFKNDIKEGAFVMSVVPGSPAAKAGLNVGDAVTSFDTKGITGPRDLIEAVKGAPQGKNEIVVTRRGESLKLKVDLGEVLAEAPEDTDFQADPRQGWIRRGDQQPNANGGNVRSRTEVKASALEMNEDLAKSLKLTDDQRKKMNEVLDKHAKALNEDVAQNGATSTKRGRKNGAFTFNMGGDVNRLVEKHAAEAEKELTGTLNADQITKWADYRKTHSAVSVSQSTMIEGGGALDNQPGNRSRVDDPTQGF